jgi:two-component system OmpR family sensor kinase
MSLGIRPSRLRRTQLRTRVLAGVLAVTLTVLASFGYAAVTMFHRYLISSTDANLKTVVSGYDRLVNSPTNLNTSKSGQATQNSSPGSGQQNVSFTWSGTIPAYLDEYGVQFRTRQGQLLELVQGDSDLVPVLPGDLASLAARRDAQTVTSSNGGTELRLMAASGPYGTLIVTASLENVNNTIGRLTIIVVIGMLAAALGVFTGVGLLVRRGLRPVETMAATADKITAGDLTIRVTPGEPSTELGRLGTALNGMLARIQSAVDERAASEQAVRQFFADTSHELRTPLASLRANAELYQQGALSRRAQVDEAMGRIVSEARRMGTLVDDMLRLARLDQHPHQDPKPVDLTALITECAERAEIASPDRNWHTHVAPGLFTTGDEEMLRRAIDNVFANVITHTPPGTTTTIVGAASASIITVTVGDDGPGVDASQLPRVFDRFYRAAARVRAPGSGLGLAIVAAVAAAHDGTVEAALNDPRGLRITFTLPRRDVLSFSFQSRLLVQSKPGGYAGPCLP